ncbi:MAG: chromosome partitioning protein ParB, partial [Alphaproteobacteria bacterium]
KASAAKDADTRALEDNLASALGLKVEISHRMDGGGTVRLAYQNVEQLDDIVSRLGRTPERPEP